MSMKYDNIEALAEVLAFYKKVVVFLAQLLLHLEGFRKLTFKLQAK